MAELLAEPTRRRVFDAVREAGSPVTREEMARAVGITTRLAAFHLDRLAEAGLLDVGYARPAGRTGPGAGRPAKRYSPAAVELDLSVPPRRYGLVARILATALAQAPPQAVAAAAQLARDEGRSVGEAHRPHRLPRSAATGLRAARDALAELGYEPELAAARLRLRNCPFHDAADVAPAVVCGLNVDLVGGVVDGVGASSVCTAALDGAAPDCCVTVSARTSRNTTVARRKGAGDVAG